MLKVNSNAVRTPPLAQLQAAALQLGSTAPAAKAQRVDQFEAVQAPMERAVPAFTTPDWSGAVAEKAPWGENELRYTVARGDTLSQIAVKFGTDLKTLVTLNDIENPNRIQVGAKISLPTTFHSVIAGDTWESIAARTGVSPAALKSINQWVFEDGGELRPGLDISAPAAVMTVVEAQTMASLKWLVENDARAHDMLFGGPVERPTYSYGFSLGWGDGGESSTFDYSDDFKALQLGPETEAQSRFTTNYAVEETRKQMILRMLEEIGYQYAVASGVDLTQHPLPERITLPDGRIQFTFLGKDATPIPVIYNWKNGGILVTDAAGDWRGNATTPLETRELAEHLGMTLPVP